MLQAFYRQSSRELRRLSSVARSPVYSGFSEAIDGAPTIRGFSAQAAFSQQNISGLEVLQRANYAGVLAARSLPFCRGACAEMLHGYSLSHPFLSVGRFLSNFASLQLSDTCRLHSRENESPSA